MAIIVQDAPEESTGGKELRSAMEISKTPPEVAAKSIERSKLFDISPDAYLGNKERLDPLASAVEKVPLTLQPETEKYLRQSESHLNLAGEDIDKMNKFEKRWSYYKEQISELPRVNRDINEIVSKKMLSDNGVLEPSDQKALDILREKRKKIQSSAQSYGIEGGEQFGVEVASATGDMLRSFYDNKGLLATMTGGGAAIGGVAGSAIPGGGTVVGALAGGAKGAVGAITLISFLDGYKQMSRSLYEDLDTMTEANFPLQVESAYGEGTISSNALSNMNIPHQTKVNVAQGVGLVGSFAASAAGFFLAKNNAFLKKFINPTTAAKAIATGTPEFMAKMNILGGIAKSVISEGTEEGFQEMLQIFGKNFGQMTESESSFKNALYNTVSDLENWKQAGKAVMVAGTTGGVVQTVTSAPAYSTIKKDFEFQQYITDQKKKVLENQNVTLELDQDMKESKIQQLAPKELTRFQQMVFGDEQIYVYLDDLRKFSNTPEKANAVRKAINDDFVKLSQELDTPVPFNKANFMEIVRDFPEITDIMRMAAEAQSPVEVRSEAENLAKALGEADVKREQLKQQLGVEELTPEQEKQIADEMIASVPDSKYFQSRDQYVGQSTVQPVEGILSQKQADEIGKAQVEARLEIDKEVVAPIDEGFKRFVQEDFEAETQQIINEQIGKLQKEYDVIDRFEKIDNLTDDEKTVLNPHWKKGYSPLAIDPRSLTEVQKAIYYNKEFVSPTYARNLKERKAFVNGGITIDEAASLAGVESGDALLKILAETPTQKQIETRVKNDPLRNQTRPQQIAGSMEENLLGARDEAFTKLTNAHIKELEIMVSNSWNTTKRAFVKIARKVPSIKELNDRAKNTVSKMKIRDVRPAMFSQAEKRTNNAAITNFADGEIEVAFDNKEKAAINSEMHREALKAQIKVERNLKFWKKMTDKDVMQELKDAGMSKVMEEYMALYKLDGGIGAEAEQKSFNKFIKDQAALGNFTPVIPERLNRTQESYKDLTVEQYQQMTEMGQFILHQARLKNKLLKKKNLKAEADEKAAELQTQETIREDVEKAAKEHFDYDENKTSVESEELKTKDQEFLEGFRNFFKTGLSVIKNIDNIVLELDQYKFDGFFYKLIADPISKATTAQRMMINDIKIRGDKIINEFYGSKEKYTKYIAERVQIDEFKNFPKIGDGKGSVRRADLLVMLAHFGEADATKRLENFVDRNGTNLDIETIRNVLDKHLTLEDAKFVQNFFLNTLKGFTEPSREMHKRVTGIDIEMIEGTPFTFKGVQFDGGYYPLRYHPLTAEQKVAMELEGLSEGPDEGKKFAKLRASEMTKQDRLKERSGSKRQIDLDYMNFSSFVQEAVHDLQFREVGIDALNILKDEHNAKNIKNIIGSNKFGVLLDSVKDTISDQSSESATLFGKPFKWIERIFNKSASLHAVEVIGFNVGSAAIQADSLNYLALQAGPKAPVYLAKTIRKMGDFSNLEHYAAEAAKILPEIALEQDQMDESFAKAAQDWNPVSTVFIKKYQKTGNLLSLLGRAREHAVQLSFELLRKADHANKVLATLALTDQFLSGDHPDFPIEKLNKMSDKEKAQTLRRVVKQTVDNTLTAAAKKDKTPLEKMALAKFFVNYWTDRRSRLNTILAQANRARGAKKRGENMKAASHLLWLGVAAGMAKAYNNLVRDEEESIINRLSSVRDAADIAEVTKDTLADFAYAPIEQTIQSIPLVDNAYFTYDMYTSGKSKQLRPITSPIFSVVTEGVRGIIALKDFLADGMRVSDLHPKDRKSIVNLMGYSIGGAPTKTLNKMIDMVEDGSLDEATRDLKGEIEDAHAVFDEFISMMEGKPEAQKLVEDVKKAKKLLPQFDAPVEKILPDNTKEIMKEKLSGGDWRKFNKDTGAAGIYQFTEAQWNRISAVNPSLGLTENGRVSKDPSQQEKAMDWEIQDNTRGLLAFKIPLTVENLLQAHEKGLDVFIEEYQKKAK